MTTAELKLQIIENFIDGYTTDEAEREEMKDHARTYVREDWVDEISQAGFSYRTPRTIKSDVFNTHNKF